MAEQLRGDQVTGIAAQFTLTKARPDVLERFVDGAGDEFLACAGLPSDQKRWCQQGRLWQSGKERPSRASRSRQSPRKLSTTESKP